MVNHLMLRLFYRHGLGVALSAAMALWAWKITDHVLWQSNKLAEIIQVQLADNTEIGKTIAQILIAHDARAKDYIGESDKKSAELTKVLIELRLLLQQRLR